MYAIAVVQGSWWCPMCGPMFSWGSSMMMFFWLVPLVVVVAGVWYAIRVALSGGFDAGRSRSVDAEEILRQRYARGEIDRETYVRMHDDLRRPPTV